MWSSKIFMSSILISKISLMRKVPAYPTSNINKNWVSAKDASLVFNLTAISATTSRDKGCFGWTGLKSFLQAPWTTDLTKGWSVGESVPAKRWPQWILYTAASITETERPSCIARCTSSVKYKATCNGIVGRTGTPSLDSDHARHYLHPLLYFWTVLAAMDSCKRSINCGTRSSKDGSSVVRSCTLYSLQ